MYALYLLGRIGLFLAWGFNAWRAARWRREEARRQARYDGVRDEIKAGTCIDHYAGNIVRLGEAQIRRDTAASRRDAWQASADRLKAARAALAGWRSRNWSYLFGVKDALLACWLLGVAYTPALDAAVSWGSWVVDSVMSLVSG